MKNLKFTVAFLLIISFCITVSAAFEKPLFEIDPEIGGGEGTSPGIGDPLPSTPFPTCTDGSLLGDINGDGRVNVADSMILFANVSGRGAEFSLREAEAADLSGDQQVTVADAMKLFRFVAGLITLL